jgi:fructan beta-fructosidase
LDQLNERLAATNISFPLPNPDPTMLNTKLRLVAVMLLVVCPTAAWAADDIVIADFEGTDYGSWVATGTAFGTGPAHGGIGGQQGVDGFQGKGLVNTFLDQDKSTGTLTSPKFKVERNFISFLIGGGHHPGWTCIDLQVDGKVVATATGSNSEHLDWETWNVRKLKGQPATIRIVDNATGGWGHICVDQIIQSDHPPVLPEDKRLYHERYRPQFHFTPVTNWTNDPNGLVFYDGEYHLFFQKLAVVFPIGTPPAWGHAVSRDLMHWQQFPDAIKPDEMGAIYSGSAVVDWKNTSGLGTGAEPPLIAMYTSAGRIFTQCIAYSNDKGRTWTKFAGNPVLPNVIGKNRDPKVTWYEPTHQWVAAIFEDGNKYGLFSSPDLKHWTPLQTLNVPGCSECPDFFPVNLDGDPTKQKWVFTCANGRYVVGQFDGTKFTIEQQRQQVEFGKNFYAVQTYSDIPAADGRRIQIAQMSGEHYPKMPFNQMMSFPCELTLHTTPDGPRLFRNPVREIKRLHGPEIKMADLTLKPGENPLADVKGDLFHILIDIRPGTAAKVGLNVRGQPITYDVASQTLDGIGSTTVALIDGHLHLEVLIDRTSIETFANDGRVSITSNFMPKDTNVPLELFAQGDEARVTSLSVFPLKSSMPELPPDPIP